MNTSPSISPPGSEPGAASGPQSPSPAAAVPAPASGGRGGTLLALFIALLALAGTGVLGWLEWRASGVETTQRTAESMQQTRLMEELQRRLGSLEASVAERDSGPDRQSIAGRLSELERRQRALESAGAEAQAIQRETAARTRSIQAALEDVHARLTGADARLATLSSRNLDSAAHLDLAELDYVLRLAQERLQLFHDVRTADQALLIADRHLESFDNPLYIGLRKEISSARGALAMAQQTDHAALYRTIENLLRELPGLPFKGETPTPAGASPDAAGWWVRIRNALSGLVTVRRDDEVALALADQDLIRQRVWLQAEAAHLAALRRDQVAYTAAVGRLSAALQDWFEPNSATLRQALEWVQLLQSQVVDPPLPDISGPWLALQALRAAGVPATVRAAPDTPPQAPSQAPPATDSAAGSEPSGASRAAPPEPARPGEENP